MSKLISEPRYRFGGSSRIQLAGPLVADLRMGWTENHHLAESGTVWATLEGDILTIMEGYTFDGCSPCFKILGRYVGTPTPARSIAAAAIHDCLRQFLGQPCLEYNRKDTDDIFYNIMRSTGFRGAKIYHGAVAGFWGTMFMFLRSPTQSKTHCIDHTPLEP